MRALAVVGALAVGMYYHDFTIFPGYAHAVTVVRLVVCKYVARGASPKCTCKDGYQLGGYSLMSCTGTAAEAWAAIVVPRLWWGQRKGGSWVKLRWLVSANTNKYLWGKSW